MRMAFLLLAIGLLGNTLSRQSYVADIRATLHWLTGKSLSVLSEHTVH
jgi:hypothetical protein